MNDYQNLNAETRRQRHAEALKELRALLTPGQDVYVIQRSVSRSGMTRRLDLYVIQRNEHLTAPNTHQMRRITWSAAHALGWPLNDTGLRVDGAGMDMHFHTVYSLGRTLWPQGVGMVPGAEDASVNDGGYALRAVTL